MIVNMEILSIEEIQNKYPKRSITSGAEVLRLSPSPTGFVHIGLLYMATICKYLAKQSDGVLILRIEDTDSKREVEGAKEEIVKQLKAFGLSYDEGLMLNNENKLEEVGNYGPYIQSERADIYKAYAYYLIEKGYAYKCYMGVEELDIMRDEQMAKKIRPGVYGPYAKYHNAADAGLANQELYEEYQRLINSKAEYVIRFRASGDQSQKFEMQDAIMGKVEVPENDEDFILIKSDGMSTYHLAHVVDDMLMGTTMVIRGNEWYSSLGKHVALWNAFGFSGSALPKYAHVSPINKIEGKTVRKLSKRKDMEADVKYFIDAGYKKEAVLAYLLRLANPSFDEYFDKAIKDKSDLSSSIQAYHLNLEELARAGRGPLLDMPKLNNISSEIVAAMRASEIYSEYAKYLEDRDTDFYKVIAADRAYTERVLNIERTGEKVRKDIYNYAMIKNQIYYMFDDVKKDILPNNPDDTSLELDKRKVFSAASGSVLFEILLAKQVLDTDENGDNLLGLEAWVEAMKEVSIEMKYEKFGEFMKDLRITITGEEKTPNLYFVLNVLGKDKVKQILGL